MDGYGKHERGKKHSFLLIITWDHFHTQTKNLAK